MNVKDYISSGIIELYALKALSESEMREVEAMANKHPEVAKELESSLNVLEDYLLIHSAEPSEGLKSKIMLSLANSNQANEIVGKQPVPFYKYLAAACIVGMILSSITLFTLFGKLKTAKTEIATLRSNNEMVAQQMDSVNFKYTASQKELQIAQSVEYKNVLLKGVDKADNCQVDVYWNNTTHETYLHVKWIHPLPKGKQYQLWALVDGKPVDAGLLDMEVASTAFQKVKNVMQAQTFAITIENEGGSESPTLSTLHVVGNV
jgi:anti-sigma-K factor RskA